MKTINCTYLVDVTFLEALEEEEVELLVLGGIFLDGFLDEGDEFLLAHVVGGASQVVLFMIISFL
jgi:hypothetical protein